MKTPRRKPSFTTEWEASNEPTKTPRLCLVSILSKNGCVLDSLSLWSTFEISRVDLSAALLVRTARWEWQLKKNLVVKQHVCAGTGVRTFLGYFSSEGHVPSHLEWVSRLVRGSVRLSVASAGTTTASWDLGSAALAVCRSVSLSLSFCLVVLLCLVLSVSLVCLPCLPCLSVSVCLSLSFCLVRSMWWVCVPTRLSSPP